MKKLLLTVFLGVFCIHVAFAQSGNSNIGTEFWTAWMDHIDPSTGATPSQMSLYIACDVATTGTVALADGSFSAPFTVQPNVVTTFAIPASAFLGNTDGIQNKGIHITSANPIAVYAHIYASAVSGATLLLPVNTMANEYYSLNYTQLSNATPSYSAFMVIGTQDSTTVQITPSAALIDGSAANKTFTITLNKGQVYQGLSGTDLTGTHILSVSTSSQGCKKIAVFSGSNKIYIGKPNMTADNLFQQVYPTASWGKTYITVPLKNRNYDVYRIVLSTPSTNVTLNGTTVPISSFTNSLYYEFNSQQTNVITADQPIQVVQYAVTQGNSITGKAINGDVGDPEMIYLNPLEQTIDHVILFSTNKYLILSGYINVVVPAAAASSFLLDGVSQASAFTPVPNNTAYSYAQLSVAVNATHVISASQGFNAIAYGFGNVESYGYAAGTNVKNLNEYVQYNNPVTNQAATSGCTGTALEPQVVLPYQTTSITWNFGNGTTPVVQTNPTYKSTFVKNGIPLYLYDYGTPVSYTAGSYAVAVTVVDPVTTVCGSNEEVDLNFNVANPPTAAFAARDTVCTADTIGFTDQSTGNGSAIQTWKWNFGNGDTSIVQNPVYKYLTPGDYTVSLTVTIATGCPSVFTKKVHVRPLPVAAFAYSTPDCETQAVTFTDQSTTAEGKITQWIWNYGDGSPPDTRTTNTPFTHTYAKAGLDTVKLQIVTNSSCYSSTITHVVTVNPHPVVSFTLPDVCLINSTAQFTDKTTISDNSNAQFTYLWNFGDAQATTANPNTSTLQNPTHQFTKAGTYTISLSVTSNNSCTTTATNTYTVSGQANFTAPATACPADTVQFTDQTDPTNKVPSSWHWNFGDGDTTNVQNPKHPFANPGTYNVVLTVSGHNGCSTTSFSRNVHINQKPVANFTFSSPDCDTKAVSFTDQSTSAEGTVAAWHWDFGDGSAPSTLQNPTHAFTPYKTYVVTLTVTSSLGCSSVSVSQQIIVNPQPVADFVLPDVCLADAAATFTAIPDKNGLVYSWNFGDLPSNISATNPNTATGLTVQHKYNSVGTYKATLTVTTNNGCIADTIKSFYVYGSSPVAAFTVPNRNDLCSNNPVTFVDNAMVPGFGDNNVTSVDMYYDFGNNPTVFVHYERPTIGQILTHTYPLETTSPHQYTVQMIAYSGQTCSNAVSQSITVLPVPTVTFATLPNVCQNAGLINLSSYMTASGPAGTAKFYQDGNYLTSGMFDPSTAALGQHVITLIYAANQTGCADTLKQNITVAPVPTVSAGADQEVILGESVTLNAIATGSNLSYLWTPAVGLNNPTLLNPKATPSVDTKYTLTVTSTTGGIACPVSDSTHVKILHLPVPPNTFTPNGDNINDTWLVKYLDQYPQCTVKIFTRNGAMIFSSVGYGMPWDGTYNGSPLPVGTYYYIIDPKHNLNVLSGAVNLIR